MPSKNKKSLQTGTAPFRAHARLIRLLGEELISDEVMAVVELVKNCYDADAQQVSISLIDITNPQTGFIQIADNGSGMSLETMLRGWLEAANSTKRERSGIKARTSFGRVLLGEKGIGRFAVDKLGSDLELVTRATDFPQEIVLAVKGHHFDQDVYLDEVENSWQTRVPTAFQGQKHGTVLNIRQLRTQWDQGMVARLHEGLVRLVSPFAIDNNFEIELHCPEFPEYNGQVVNRLLESAPYQLAGIVDSHGIMTVSTPELRVIDLRELCRDRLLQADGKLREPVCGPFSIMLHIWDLEPPIGNATGVNNALRKMIKSRSGISIYRDNFRIWPYGERDDDWLELNQRRVNNPTLRVSNNQVVGFVGISYASNPDLRDRTSREGLLENQAYSDLKILVLAAISIIETERFNVRRGLLPVKPDNSRKKDDPIIQMLMR